MALSFPAWLKEVDRQMESCTGVSIDYLADQPYRDWYDDGLEPGDVLGEIIDNEGIEEWTS